MSARTTRCPGSRLRFARRRWSTTVTSSPNAPSASTRCDPMNPAPPVTMARTSGPDELFTGWRWNLGRARSELARRGGRPQQRDPGQGGQDDVVPDDLRGQLERVLRSADEALARQQDADRGQGVARLV